MPDIWMDVDSAVVVPVNVLPLLDDTDFKTIETAIVYNSAGLVVTWNFVTSAGVQTGTAITPTTGGNYDWAEPIADKGMYTIEIPASGGASANNDTEGYGWITGVATGVLPWRGPIIGFRAAALNDALCDGGDNLDVNTVQWLGTACATPTVAGVPEVDITHMAGGTQTVTDLKDFADTGYDPATHKVETVKLADTITTYTGNTLQTGDSFAIVNHVTYGNSAIENLVDGIETTLGTPAGASISADIASIKTDTGTTIVNHLTGIKGATFDTATDSLEAIRNRGDAAWITATGFSTHSAADVWAVATRVLTAGTNIALAKGTGVTGFNDIAASDILAAALTESYAANGATFTLTQAVYMIWSALSEFAIGGTTITAKKLDGTTTSMTFTLDSATDPTSRTRAT